MKSVGEVLKRAEDTLYTARLGAQHVNGSDPKARLAGLRNVAVFGRAVTNVLQTLRSVVTDFDAWYQPHVEAMRKDELMSFFYRIRSEILKEGSLRLSTSMTLSGNPMAFLNHFEKPPGAKGFFIGDNIGGSGWEVETSEGVAEKFYVNLPSDLPGLKVDMKVHFADAPVSFSGTSANELCERYLEKLQSLLDDAKAKFKQ